MLLFAGHAAVGGVHWRDSASTSAEAYYLLTLLAAGMLTLRQDGAGHLSATFERRLARLPLSTRTLVTVLFSARLLAMAMLIAAAAICYRLCYGVWLEPFALTLPIVALALAQMLAWCRGAFTGLDYALPLSLLAVPLVLRPAGWNYLESLELWGRLIASPMGVAVVVAGAYASSLAAIEWERRDIRRGLPTAAELRDWLDSLLRSRPDTASPLAAQAWYETRRMGATMLLLYLGMFAAAALVAASFEGVRANASMFTQYGSLVLLPLASMMNSLACLWPKSRYADTRPIPSGVMAKAKLIALSRALTITGMAAAVVSIGGFMLTAAPIEREMMVGGWQAGYLSTAELVAVFLGPCLIAMGVAWVCSVAMTGTLPVALGSVGGLVFVGALVFLPRTFDGDTLQSEAPHIIACLAAACCLAVLGQLLFAWVRKAMSTPAVFWTLGLWGLASAAMLVIGPSEIRIIYNVPSLWGAFAGNDMLHAAAPLPWWAYLPAPAFGALCVLPIIALAIASERRRLEQ